MIWLKIIWLLLGLIGWLFTYHSIRKEWYDFFKCEYWKSKHKKGLLALCILSPILIFGGLLTILLSMTTINKKNWSLYFNIKRYEKKLNKNI
jgi:predicted small integral membrane protein